jgi:hypothetical protein
MKTVKMLNKMSKLLISICGILIMLFMPLSVIGQESNSWDGLSSEQQEVLKPFAGNWQDLPENRRRALQRGAERWSKMTVEQRQNARNQFRKWNSFDQDKKQVVRRRYNQFNDMSIADREKLRRRQEWFRGLSPEVQTALRERWEAMSPDERTAMWQERPEIISGQREQVREYVLGLNPDERQDLEAKWRLMTPEEKIEFIERTTGQRPDLRTPRSNRQRDQIIPRIQDRMNEEMRSRRQPSR